MNISEEQRQTVIGWVEAGVTPGEVQKRLKDEFGMTLTYLDLRLLLDDLKVVPKEEPEPEAPAAEATDAADAADAITKEMDDDLADLGGTGKVRLTLDQITRPSALVSGKVTFSDGQRAEWYVDTMGRPALNPETPGYRPSQEDIMSFQMELQRAISQGGF
jgi:hypothetical protein